MANQQSKKSIRFSNQNKIENIKRWYNQWIYVGHSDELNNNGDFFTIQIIDYPIIILKDDNDEIIALSNTCRHRGSKICQTERGHGSNLVCPYHQWTYDLSGQLKYAHSMMEEINCKDFKLKQYPLSIDNGHIFINLSQDETLVPLGSNFTEESIHSSLVITNVLEDQPSESEPLNRRLRILNDLPLLDINTQTLLATNCYLLDCSDIEVVLMSNPIALDRIRLTVKIFAKYGSVNEEVAKELLNALSIDYDSSTFFNEDKLFSNKEKKLENQELIEQIAKFEDKPSDLTEAKNIRLAIADSHIWSSEIDDLICTMIIDESTNVKTFTFQSDPPRLFTYKPGQFITLELPTATEEPTLRTYTLSSSPSRPLSISVTAKAQAESFGTRWMFENITVGSRLRAFGPTGHFSFFDKPAEKYLFISAGSGITPMISMTRWMYDHGSDMDINFISCVQTPQDILFKKELENIAYRSEDIRVTWVCEEDAQNLWTGYRGRFNKLILGLAASDYMDRAVYCCGPAPFMQAVRDALIDSGYDMNKYHEEQFSSIEANEQPQDYSTTISDKKTFISFAKSKKEIEATQIETLLTAAKRANIAIPSACSVGVCGTCRVKVNSGETHMVHSGGISQQEIDQGYVLACCTKAMDKVDLEI
jgi:ferredoxin-NADP reductase/nitrite reductase/ring-hydroxylating ferredoxin subunit